MTSVTKIAYAAIDAGGSLPSRHNALNPMTPSQAILTVEDAFLVGLQLKRDVESLGYEVLGPAPTAEAALALLDHPNLAFAILDINLGEENSIPVAKALQDRGIPFVFITGYQSVDVAGFERAEVIRKPASTAQILSAITSAVPPPTSSQID
jgi:ActR/RegA family two-component response regulator